MNIMGRLRGLILFFCFFLIIPGCSVVKEGKQIAALAKCDFRILSVTNLHLLGISVQNITSINDLNLIDAQQLIRGVMAPKAPLTFFLNVEAKNPNTDAAGMKKLEWILFIDDIRMTEGSVDEEVMIPPNNGVVTIPVRVSADLKKVLQGKSMDAILNFGMNLAGIGNKPTRFLIKIKPTIMIGKKSIVYPGYINVKTEYTSQ